MRKLQLKSYYKKNGHNYKIYVLTSPTKKRTATDPDFTASYCIHVLLIDIRCLKLVAVEKTPMKRSKGKCSANGPALSTSRSVMVSTSSDVGNPVAKAEISSKSPEI